MLVSWKKNTTNISNETIKTGSFGTITLTPTITSYIFYENEGLKIITPTTPTTKFFEETYIDNQHVEFTEQQSGVSSCDSVNDLKPNSSTECYVHVSFAGLGKYLIVLEADLMNDRKETYLIDLN